MLFKLPGAFRRLRSFIVLEYKNDLNEHNRGTVSIMSVSQGKCLYFRTQYLLTGFVFSLEVLKRSAFYQIITLGERISETLKEYSDTLSSLHLLLLRGP